MKIKRPQIRKAFRDELDLLYKQVDALDAGKPIRALM
jgi:hypothetical protein